MPKELELLQEWKQRLGLQNWQITLTDNVDPEDMTVKDAMGCTSYQEVMRTASIQIINPEKIEETLRPFDYEETLVHELLHLKLGLLERGTDWDNKLQLRVLHMIIDDLARALVDAKRFGCKQEDVKNETKKSVK